MCILNPDKSDIEEVLCLFLFFQNETFFFFLPNQFLGSILRQLTPSFTSQKPSTYLLVFSISCS